MREENYRSPRWKGIVRHLCFIVFGFMFFYNPFDPFNPFNAFLGVLVCLLVGWLYRLFLRLFLFAGNGDVRREIGSWAIRMAVDNAMLFLIPFVVLVVLSTLVLGWSMSVPFISTGILAVGTTAAIEVGRLSDEPRLRNTVLASATSFGFAFLLTWSLQTVGRIPGLVEGVVLLIPNLIRGGGLF